MSSPLITLKKCWLDADLINDAVTSQEQISLFEVDNNLLIPEDLNIYFSEVNGTSGNYDDNLFCFCSFTDFKKVYDEMKDWKGLPHYVDTINSLTNSNNYYIIADYQFHLIIYAIELNREKRDVNLVVAICGEEAKVVATSFLDFIQLYLQDSPLLYMNDV